MRTVKTATKTMAKIKTVANMMKTTLVKTSKIMIVKKTSEDVDYNEESDACEDNGETVLSMTKMRTIK